MMERGDDFRVLRDTASHPIGCADELLQIPGMLWLEHVQDGVQSTGIESNTLAINDTTAEICAA